MKNLYLIKRTDKWSYDDYDSAVVIAENEESAKRLDISKNEWYTNAWTKPENVKVTYLGPLQNTLWDDNERVVCASFNAG